VINHLLPDGDLLITRPMYSGQVMATLKVKSTPILATVRPNTWAPAQADSSQRAEVETFGADDLPEARTEVLAVEAQGGDRPDLSDAATVDVSSTEIRRAARTTNAERAHWNALVPPPVADYIRKYGLYRNTHETEFTDAGRDLAAH
jgi:hypothetical protein